MTVPAPPLRVPRRAVLGGGLAAMAAALADPLRAQVLPARTVHTAAELETAFAAAPDGSRILLAPGRYDRANLRNRSFARGLVLTSADPAQRAVFAYNLYLDGVEGMTITGVDFATGGFFEHRGRLDKVQLGLTGCRNIVVQDGTFTGHIPTAQEGIDPEAPDLDRHFALAGYARDVGMAVNDSRQIRIEGLRLNDLRIAITSEGSAGVEMLGLEIARAREGINLVDSRDLVIAACHFHSFRPWLSRASPKRDHPDMIQYWAGKAGRGIDGLTVRDCLFHQGPGDPWTQTIFGHMQNVKTGTSLATGVKVTGNTIVNRHIWGIYFGDARDVDIAGNLLLPSPDLPDAPAPLNTPTISLERASEVRVRGNTLLPYQGLARPIRAEPEALADGRVRVERDNRFLATRPVMPEFWRKLEPDLSSPAAAYRAGRGWPG